MKKSRFRCEVVHTSFTQREDQTLDREGLDQEEDRIGEYRRRIELRTEDKEARKLAPEVRIKQIGMREDLLSIIRHTSSDHFSEEL